MTAQQEDTIINEFLAQFLDFLGQARLVSTIARQHGVEHQANVLLNRLLSEGLATQVAPEFGHFLVSLTPKGVEVARHPGGYLGYLSELEKARMAKQQQEQELAQAAITSAKATASAARAAWVAAGFSLLSILISLFALWQASK